MTRIFCLDVLIADIIADGRSTALRGLIEKYALESGGKRGIGRHEFEEFSGAVRGLPITIAPGGSSANTLTTLQKLLPQKVEVHMQGVLGKSLYSQMIRESLAEAGVQFHACETQGASPEAAVSFVLAGEGGARTIATYPGNLRELLAPEHIAGEVLSSCDVLFLQGSLYERVDEAVVEALLAARVQHKKALWLALPTHAKLGVERLERFDALIPEAALLLGNGEELCRIFDAGEVDAALLRLSSMIAHGVGFITLGDAGAAVVEQGRVMRVAPMKPARVETTLGAGDTAFAGFTGGALLGWTYSQSAAFAMELAAAKLAAPTARLEDPHAMLHAFCTRQGLSF